MRTGSLGMVAHQEERYEDAASHYAKALQLAPGFSGIHAGYAIALALAGRVDEAQKAARKALELEPTYRVGNMIQLVRSAAFVEKWRTGARLAGLPE